MILKDHNLFYMKRGTVENRGCFFRLIIKSYKLEFMEWQEYLTHLILIAIAYLLVSLELNIFFCKLLFIREGGQDIPIHFIHQTRPETKSKTKRQNM